MYLIVERKKFDNLPIERKYLFIVKSYEIDYHTARKKKEGRGRDNTKARREAC